MKQIRKIDKSIPPKLYHATPIENLEAILNDGLIPSIELISSIEGKYKGSFTEHKDRVFLSKYNDPTNMFLPDFKLNRKLVILEIETIKLKKECMYPDDSLYLAYANGDLTMDDEKMLFPRLALKFNKMCDKCDFEEWEDFIVEKGYPNSKIERLWRGKGYLTLHNNLSNDTIDFGEIGYSDRISANLIKIFKKYNPPKITKRVKSNEILLRSGLYIFSKDKTANAGILSDPKGWEEAFLNKWIEQNESFFRGYEIEEELDEIRETYYNLIQKYNGFPFNFTVYRAINLREYEKFIEMFRRQEIKNIGISWGNAIEDAESYDAKSKLKEYGYKIIFEAEIKKEQVNWFCTLLQNTHWEFSRENEIVLNSGERIFVKALIIKEIPSYRIIKQIKTNNWIYT